MHKLTPYVYNNNCKFCTFALPNKGTHLLAGFLYSSLNFQLF